jgi:hypothetical protein
VIFGGFQSPKRSKGGKKEKVKKEKFEMLQWKWVYVLLCYVGILGMFFERVSIYYFY